MPVVWTVWSLLVASRGRVEKRDGELSDVSVNVRGQKLDLTGRLDLWRDLQDMREQGVGEPRDSFPPGNNPEKPAVEW